jgi:hypothetical protein
MSKPVRQRAVLAAATVACTAVALCAPSVAAAAVSIGGDVSAPGNPVTCGTGVSCDGAQLALVGGQTTAPFAGVVVRWRVNGATGPLTLRVLRPAGLNFTFISSSVAGTASGTGVQTFATRQPIQAGDYVGLGVGPTSSIGSVNPAPAGDTAAAFGPPSTPDGNTVPPAASEPGTIFAYNADVEPDADHDGFGDETQDQCPTNATTQGPCPPPPDINAPVLASSAHSAVVSRTGAISFFVKSDENSTGTATGTISVPKLAKTVRFAKRTVTLTAGKRTKVTLKLSKKNAALVLKALKRHKKLKAKVTLSAKDAAGNPSTKKLSLKLKR